MEANNNEIQYQKKSATSKAISLSVFLTYRCKNNAAVTLRMAYGDTGFENSLYFFFQYS